MTIQERERFVLDLYNQGKNIREIAKEARISFRDIGVILNNYYDKEKYREMILDAAETVLGIFAFDRTIYGNAKYDKRKRKWWWQDLIEKERTKDIQAEIYDGKKQ